MFQLKQEQFARLRRKKIGDGLIASFSGGPVRARWNEQKNYVIATDPLDNHTRFGFDENGFIAAVASPTGRLWQMANYPDGKTAVIKNPAGHQLTLGYTQAGQLQSIASDGRLRLQLHYNEQQKAIATSFPDGTFSSIEYTLWNAPWVVSNRLGQRDISDYDEHRRLTALTDGNGSCVSFVYGEWSRPDQTLFPNNTSESYNYSEKGYVTKIATDETSLEVESDDKGRPTTLSYSDGVKISRKYDDQGRTAEAALFIPDLEEPYVSKYAWNDAGQLESEQSGSASVAYEYDKAGRLMALTYPGGKRIEYEWDADSRLVLVRDWNAGEHRIEYAPHDRGSLLTSPNGLHTLTLLTNLGHPENIAVSHEGNPLFSLAYTYDAEDRVASLFDSAFGLREFRYDPESQLLAVESQGETPSESFVYDAAGNPLEISGTVSRYDEANQLLERGHSFYDYDCRGNLIRMDTAEGIWRFAWSACNLMIASESPTGVLTRYDYDAFGRRIRKYRQDFSIDFVWAGEQLIGETITAGDKVIRRDYLYYPGSFTPLAMRVDGQVYSFHCDHLGTTRTITASDGSAVWLADYSGFGHARVAPGSFVNPLRSPGQYFDEETGLHYNRFRYYSPQLARYISRDPIGFLAGSNFYRYAANNPINRIDPLGLWTWAGVGEGIAAAGAAVAVGAAVIAFAPVALAIAVPLAIIAGGAAAAAVVGGMNQALDESQFCPSCIAQAALKAVTEFGSGVMDATVRPLVHLVLHPVDTATALVHAIAHPINTAIAIKNAVVKTGAAALSGDPRAMGQVAGTVAALAVPGADEAEAGDGIGTSTLGADSAADTAKTIESSRLPAVALTKEGWPDLPASQAPNFVSAEPVTLRNQTIYRVIDDPSNAGGGYWTEELPVSKAAWRSDSAVLPSWNDNGLYTEYQVGDEGLNVWKGPASSQGSLPGGGDQLWMPPGTVSPTSIKPTGW